MINRLDFKVNEKIRILSEYYIICDKWNYYDITSDFKWIKYKIRIVGSNDERWLIWNQVEGFFVSAAGDYNLNKEVKEGFKRATINYSNNEEDIGKIIEYDYCINKIDNRLFYKQIINGAMEEIECEFIEDIVIEVLQYKSKEEYKQEKEKLKMLQEIEEKEAEKVDLVIPVPLGDFAIYPIKVRVSKLVIVIMVVIFILGKGLNIIIKEYKMNDKGEIGCYMVINNDFESLGSSSSINNSETSYLYSTYLSLDTIVMGILRDTDTSYEEMFYSNNKDAIAVITNDEYCFIYKGLDGQTFVQVNYRLYTYSNNIVLYNSSEEIKAFYEECYYNNAYEFDKQRFQQEESYYENKSHLKEKDTLSKNESVSFYVHISLYNLNVME